MKTNSLVNRMIEQSSSRPAPTIGDGATVAFWTDRAAATVTAVSPSGKTVTIREDHAIRTDANGMSDAQAYRYEPNPEGRVWTVRQTRRGWRADGTPVTFGVRMAYHDYTF